jgi:hypothetical protein
MEYSFISASADNVCNDPVRCPHPETVGSMIRCSTCHCGRPPRGLEFGWPSFGGCDR